MKLQRFSAVLVACSALAFGVAACGDDDSSDSGSSGGADTASVSEDLSGSVRIDGSSTVQPVARPRSSCSPSEAPNVDISVGGIGTGDGFERFCRGELQIADASRGIEKEEYDACKKANITPVEVQVGIDGLTRRRQQGSRDPGRLHHDGEPQEAARPEVEDRQLLGARRRLPGPEGVVLHARHGVGHVRLLHRDGARDRRRAAHGSEVQTSADDNQIVTGIEGTEGALGYVGFAYADSQKDKLKILAVDGGDGCVKPAIETIADGTYKPLSRPLFMYPRTETAAKPEVKAFIQYVLDNNEQVNEAADYVPLTDELLTKAKANLDGATPVAAPAK